MPNNIEFNLEFVKDYFKIDYDEEDEMLEEIIEMADSYISTYTDMTIEQAHEHKEVGYAFLLLVDYMYNQRTVVIDPNKINPMLDKILNLNAMWTVF